MRQKIKSKWLWAGLACLALFALFLPYYRQLYNTPAIRFREQLYLQTETAGGTLVYTADKDTITITPVENGAQISVDWFPYTAQTFTILEEGTYREVYDKRGTLALAGYWGKDESFSEVGLSDPKTGRQKYVYDQQRTWDTPTAPIALELYEHHKTDTRGHGNPLRTILIGFGVCFLSLLSVAVPGGGWNGRYFAKHPNQRQFYILLYTILPFFIVIFALVTAIT